MKKISYLLSILIFSTLTPLLRVNAQLSNAFDGNSALNKVADKAKYDTAFTFIPFLGSIISLILSILGAVFIILMVYGGFEWMTAGGIETKIEKAKEIIRQSFIGFVIALGAYAISYFFIRAFAGK